MTRPRDATARLQHIVLADALTAGCAIEALEADSHAVPWRSACFDATRHHLQGLRENGLTPFHRTAYAPVRTFILQPTSLDDLLVQVEQHIESELDGSIPTPEAVIPALA